MARISNLEVTKSGSTSSYLIEPTLYITPTLASGSTTIYNATLTDFELAPGATVQAKFAATNAASAQLNVNSTGDKNIYYAGSAIAANTFKANHIYTLVYDGTQW
jgi:hypothetical protein